MKRLGHYTEQFVNKLKAKTEEQEAKREQPEAPEKPTAQDAVALKFSDNSMIKIGLASGAIDLGVLSCILLAEHRKGGDPDNILNQLGIADKFNDMTGNSIYKKPKWR